MMASLVGTCCFLLTESVFLGYGDKMWELQSGTQILVLARLLIGTVISCESLLNFKLPFPHLQMKQFKSVFFFSSSSKL